MTQRRQKHWRLFVARFAGAFVLLGAAAPRPSLAQGGGAMPAHGIGTMELDRVLRTFLLADVLEYEARSSHESAHFEGLGWIGGDYNRLWLRALAEQPTNEGTGDYQVDAYYGRLISPFWNALAGARVDSREWNGRRVNRGLLAIGLEGIAPYWFETEPTLYVSQKGDVAARFEAATDVLFSQRLIVQPRLEVNAAAQRVPEFGVGSGINDVNIGFRARYEFTRKFAPYIGVSWVRRTGETAVLARRAGEIDGYRAIVFGLRAWR